MRGTYVRTLDCARDRTAYVLDLWKLSRTLTSILLSTSSCHCFTWSNTHPARWLALGWRRTMRCDDDSAGHHPSIQQHCLREPSKSRTLIFLYSLNICWFVWCWAKRERYLSIANASAVFRNDQLTIAVDSVIFIFWEGVSVLISRSPKTSSTAINGIVCLTL